MLRRSALFLLLVASPACATANGAADEAAPDASVKAPSDASVDAPGSEGTIFPVDDALADYGVEDVTVADAEVGAKTIDLLIDGIECRTITCPTAYPYVVGCSISMNGSSGQACIAHAEGASVVTFKEGQSCGGVYVKGIVTCSADPGPPLDATNCIVNKPKALYIASLSLCPG